MITQKAINQSANMKLEYIVIYENSSDKFNTGHSQIKVKFTVGLSFSPFHHNTQLWSS